MIICPCCAKCKLAIVSSRFIDIDGEGVLICHDCFIEDVYREPENKKRILEFLKQQKIKEV